MQPIPLGSQLIFGMAKPHGSSAEIARRLPCILVVDDKLDTLLLVRELLTSRGYQVFTASDAEEAMTAIREYKPDLILLDVLLSGKDGREIVKQLKSQEETKSIPIIMFSAHPSAEKTAREAGADDFVAKPFHIDHLLAVVAKYL